MSKPLELTIFYLLLGATIASAGCGVAPLYRPARPLDPGENEVAASLATERTGISALAFSNGADTATHAATTRTTAAPQLHIARGFGHDLDATARLSFSANWIPYAGLGGQYQFYNAGPWHLAVAPEIGGRPAAFSEPRLGQVLLPVVASWDYDANWGVTAGLHAGYRWTNLGVQDPHALALNDFVLHGVSGATYGGGLGVDYHTEILRVQGMLTWMHTGGFVSSPGNLDYPINALGLTISGAYLFGKEIKKMEKTDYDIDRLIR